MSEPTVVQPTAVEDKPNPAAAADVTASEDVLPTGESVQNQSPQAEVAVSFKTLKVLQEWQIVPYILKRGQDAYKSVKHSTKISKIGLDITEKVLATFTACSANVMKKMTPVLRLVDYPVGEGLERLQKRFPVVTQSPEKIYDSAVERLVKFTGPTVNKAIKITRIGRKNVEKAIRTTVKTCRKIITLLENRLEHLENYITEKRHGTASQPECVPSTWAGKLRGAACRALRVPATLSLFWVGAACWLLERLPLVGRLLADNEACASLPPSSPPSRKRSTDSLYVSLSDLPTAGEGQSSPLPPQLSQATQ